MHTRFVYFEGLVINNVSIRDTKHPQETKMEYGNKTSWQKIRQTSSRAGVKSNGNNNSEKIGYSLEVWAIFWQARSEEGTLASV
jgi:hypothetical protein